MTIKTIIINGNNFSDIEGFYNEIDKVMTSGLDWVTGHNLDAFNDILRGGFGVYDYGEHINLIWTNSHKSKSDLHEFYEDQTIYEILIYIIKSHDHIMFNEN